MDSKVPHISVLLNEVVDYLNPQSGLTYVDCTFGAGGYSRRILDCCDCTLIAMDRDETTLKTATDFKSQYKNRFEFAQDKFSNIKSALAGLDIEKVDGIVCDLGVSSMQIDNADNGFSFMREGPLKMQMGCNDESAYDIVNDYDEEDIANIIYKYGEERFSRRIAKAIISTRKEKAITTTTELAGIVASAVPGKGQIHPATRTFQALRIYVNNELEEIEKILSESLGLLNKGGRIVMVSFHSLEDRIIKNFFNEQSGKNSGVSRYLPAQQEVQAKLKIITKKPITASDEELNMNVRSRSAKLRAAEKL